MTSTSPPPYAPDDTKGLYPAAADAHPPQQQPGVVTFHLSGPTYQSQHQEVNTVQLPTAVSDVPSARAERFIFHIVLSCFAFWFCILMFTCAGGLIGFILARKSRRYSFC